LISPQFQSRLLRELPPHLPDQKRYDIALERGWARRRAQKELAAALLSCLTMLKLPVTDDQRRRIQRSRLITLDYWLEDVAYVESVGELLDSD
jgi:hypothetical protein